jgi:hypothetical protein
MRCVDVIQELAAPTGGPESTALADHLAHCPECASQAARDRRLDRLWDATRPLEPSALAWDVAWNRLSGALDRPTAPEILPFAATAWRRAAVAVLGLAQAAALLFILVYHSQPMQKAQVQEIARIAPVEVAPPVPSAPIEIEAGQLAVIRGDGMTDLALNDNAAGLAFTFDGLNSLEAIAQQ